MQPKFIMQRGALFAAVGIWAGASLAVQAAITLDISGAPPVPPPTYIAAAQYGTSNEGLLNYLQSNFSGLGSLVFKYDVGGNESGLLGASYTAVHTPAAPNPPPYETVTLTYNGGAVADANYIVVKDGTAGAYVWNVGPYWSGTETLIIVNDFFTGGNGNELQGISNVQMFGAGVAPPPIPEATTFIAGAGALGLLFLGAGVHPRRSKVLRIGR